MVYKHTSERYCISRDDITLQEITTTISNHQQRVSTRKRKQVTTVKRPAKRRRIDNVISIDIGSQYTEESDVFSEDQYETESETPTLRKPNNIDPYLPTLDDVQMYGNDLSSMTETGSDIERAIARQRNHNVNLSESQTCAPISMRKIMR